MEVTTHTVEVSPTLVSPSLSSTLSPGHSESSETVPGVQVSPSAEQYVWVPGEPPTVDVPSTTMIEVPMILGADTGPNATHALHNPLKPMIPVSHKSRRQDKFTRFVSRQKSKEKQLTLQRDLKAFRLWREREIKTLALRHNKRVGVIQQLVLKKTLFRPARCPMLQNALVHHKAKELKDQWMPGDPPITLEAIQTAIKVDKATKPPLSRERKQELMDELTRVREIRSVGARVSNKAAALDYQNTIKRIAWEIKALYECTGAIGFACFSQNHVNDSLFPAWMDSKESLQFFADVFKMTPSELTRKFEAWAVARTKGLNYAERTKSIRKECMTLINNGLNSILNRAGIEMQYANYKRKICMQFGIHLRGWPADIKFDSPSKLNAEDARKLRDALRSGSCIWVSMTWNEYKEMEESLEGEIVPQRAPRKDKGKARGKQKQAEGSQAGMKRPRKKVTKQLPPMQSAEFIEESESEDEYF